MKKLSFPITAGTVLSMKNGKQDALLVTFQDGTLTAKVFYDYSEEPLVLTAEGSLGDEAELVLLPHRLELYVKGVLWDEEWPYGTSRMEGGEWVARQGVCTPYEEPREEGATVLGTFTDARSWSPGKQMFVGDCMPYTRDGRYHVLYLKDRHHHGSKWGKGAHQWAHISTADFHTWQIHPMAVEIDDPSEASICTGSHIEKDGIHYLFYTVRRMDGAAAPICRSVSEDGYRFRKDRDFGFTLSKHYTGETARDPKVVKAADGTYHMFLTTTLKQENRGCLAHFTSMDLEYWQETTPIYIGKDHAEPECADYFYFRGYYYLVFSLYLEGQYLYSEKPFSDWRVPADAVIPCKSVPKCAVMDDRIIFTGFDGNGRYGGTLTFTEAKQKENGELEFYPMR